METEHYNFHYKTGTLAKKEIQQVIELQESCYKEITDRLEFVPKKKIIYWLCDTRVEVMQISGYEYETFGMLFIADIFSFEEIHSEIEKIIICDELVENWTYPLIQPKLLEEVERRRIL